MKITTSDRRAANIGRETPSSSIIDDYVLKRIDFRARQLAIKFQLPDDRRDDLAQEMVVELLTAAERFDPDGAATWHTYASRVLDLAVKKLAQNERRARQRAAGRVLSLSQAPDGCPSVVDPPARGGDGDLAQLELKLDVEAVLARMPQRLRKACELLMRLSPAEAAEALGIHRNSIYRLISEAREYFLDPKSGFADFSAEDSVAVRM